jgi:uncharacterized OsmC-like protein
VTTDATGLRARQAPLKERYRSDPASASTTLHAEGALSGQEVACDVATGRAMVAAGLHPMTGGDGTRTCSGDLLLQALVACAGVTLRAVATARGLDVAGRVRAEGDLDFRGTLGLDPHAPVGFASIRLRFELTSPAPGDALDELVATTSRYCVVLQSLLERPAIDVAWSRDEAAGQTS